MIRHNISGILKSQEPKTCLSLCSQNNLAAAQNCRATECSYVPSRLVLFVSSACNREWEENGTVWSEVLNGGTVYKKHVALAQSGS